MFKNLTANYGTPVQASASGSSTTLPSNGRNRETHVARLPSTKSRNPIDG